MKIPRIIHQTYFTNDIPLEIQDIIIRLRVNNPNWEYRFYNDNDVLNYIKNNFSDDILCTYLKINKKYGAARADFFRYLVIYKEGGVYLDIKSTCIYALDDIINENDEFILCHWQNDVGMKSQFAGIHEELKNIPYGEFQQWHIIAKSGSPFLEKVIEVVVNNINSYNPWIHNIGKRAVLRVTGPIAYTKAIYPLLNCYSYTWYRYDSDIGLTYSELKHDFKHIEIMGRHYSLYLESLVYFNGFFSKLNFWVFSLVRKFKRFIFN